MIHLVSGAEIRTHNLLDLQSPPIPIGLQPNVVFTVS